MKFNIVFKFEGEYDMNKDHYERDNKESGQYLDQGDEIRTSSEQNDNKEEIDIEKYHGIFPAY